MASKINVKAGKVTFGKRRIGKAQKRLNKHDSAGKPYRGQGK